jgi:hypothetical protein
MPAYSELTDFNDSRLDVFARLNENQLRHYYEPNGGLFIAESPKVTERALGAGCVPVAALVERSQAEGEAAEAQGAETAAKSVRGRKTAAKSAAKSTRKTTAKKTTKTSAKKTKTAAEPKPKRQLTEAQKAALAAGREKARLKREAEKKSKEQNNGEG